MNIGHMSDEVAHISSARWGRSARVVICTDTPERYRPRVVSVV
jgi:hypothetical protein